MKKKVLGFISLVCVFCMMIPLMPATPVLARTTDEVQGDIDAKKEYLEQLEGQIASGKSDKAAAEAAIAEYQENYESLLALIDEQDALINSTEGRLDKKGDELSETIQKLQDNKEKFENRLVAIYKVNNSSVLSAIFNVDSFSEFFQLLDALQRISMNDTAMLDELMAEREKYERQQVEIEGSITDLTTQMEDLQENRDWAAAKVEEMQYLADQAQQKIDSGEAESDLTEAELAQLQAEYAAAFAEAERLASSNNDGSVRQTINGPVTNDPAPEPPVDNSGGDSSGSQPDPTPAPTPDPGGTGGTLAWPVPGYYGISSYFGDPRANTGWHYGIDIPAPQGTTITAAAPGTVIVARYDNSYGNYIVIDHGDGLRTLYAHCHTLYVGAGATVNTGASIAGVGDTGDSYGAHLHFEVHDGGGRQNPLSYVNL